MKMPRHEQTIAEGWKEAGLHRRGRAGNRQDGGAINLLVELTRGSLVAYVTRNWR